jgi:predicted RNA-binding Zn-ribbon protein involved in translation (DUF1610 family)
MAIEVTCNACGKVLKARDETAGKRTSCPGCGSDIRIPETSNMPFEDSYELVDEDDPYGSEVPDADRKPCRACGEMVVRTAAKCRFCGELFDRSLAGSARISPEGEVSRHTISDFKSAAMNAGAIWLIMGLLAMALFGFLGDRLRFLPGGKEILTIVMCLCVLWIIFGAFSIARQMWAIWSGLILSYLSLLGNVAQVAQGDSSVGCGMVLLILAIVKAHKAISLAGEIKRSGVMIRDI